MQKVIKRAVLAERQAARRLARRKDKNLRDWRKSNREQVNYVRRDEMGQLKQARLNRREDWELGPLAPRRDVGNWTDTYGTINSQRARGQELSIEKQEEKLKAWGGKKFLNLRQGDRVVLLEGRDKGKIGTVKEINTKAAEVSVEGLNMIDVNVPKWMISAEDSDKRPIRTMEKPVPINTVRLVVPLTDEETGKTRDVIVKKVASTKPWFDKATGHKRWSRIIPGLNIKIPWPKQEPKIEEDQPDDTLRIDVETKTFIPTLTIPPMPGGVIDELRNKYSVFRTRHEPEYIAAKMEEDRLKEEKKKEAEKMRTPLKEINRRERKLRKAKGKGTLTPEMMENIGKIIAQKRQLTMAAVGVSKEAVAPEPVAA